MTRTAGGLLFEIVSPSHWQLAGYPVELAYLGDAWFLSLLHVLEDGNTDVQMRKLLNRDEGINLISEAFQRHHVVQ